MRGWPLPKQGFLRFVRRSGEILLQNSAILRKAARIRFPETPSTSNDAQRGENAHKNFSLN